MQNIELQPMSPSIPLEAEYLRLTDCVADGIDGYTCCNISIDSTTSYKSMAVFSFVQDSRLSLVGKGIGLASFLVYPCPLRCCLTVSYE